MVQTQAIISMIGSCAPFLTVEALLGLLSELARRLPLVLPRGVQPEALRRAPERSFACVCFSPIAEWDGLVTWRKVSSQGSWGVPEN